MEDILTVQFSWGYLFTSLLLLLGLFFALQFVNRLLQRAAFMGRWHKPIQGIVRSLILIFEPLAIIWIGGIFVLINPLFHGLLLALVFLSAYQHLRNYIAGRFIQMDRQIERGARLRTGTVEGVVLYMGRLGLQLQTKEGLYQLTYSIMQEAGYTLIAGDEIGGFYQLLISPMDSDSKVRHLQTLQQLMVTAPYLDWSHKPELNAVGEGTDKVQARILVREENHLYDLIALIREWGYHCKIGDDLMI